MSTKFRDRAGVSNYVRVCLRATGAFEPIKLSASWVLSCGNGGGDPFFRRRSLSSQGSLKVLSPRVKASPLITSWMARGGWVVLDSCEPSLSIGLGLSRLEDRHAGVRSSPGSLIQTIGPTVLLRDSSLASRGWCVHMSQRIRSATSSDLEKPETKTPQRPPEGDLGSNRHLHWMLRRVMLVLGRKRERCGVWSYIIVGSRGPRETHGSTHFRTFLRRPRLWPTEFGLVLAIPPTQSTKL